MISRIARLRAKKGFTIVSGMARGIDSIAHQSAIKEGGKTIAVLGSGIDYAFPPSNDGFPIIRKGGNPSFSTYST